MTSRRFALQAIVALPFVACRSLYWRLEPVSATTNTSPIARKAIRIYDDDVAAVEKVGGLPIGTLDMNNLYDIDTDSVRAGAECGGTHIFALVTPTRKRSIFKVYRVPRGAWEHLPHGLRPKPLADED